MARGEEYAQGVNTAAQPQESLQRESWRRALSVFVSPRPVFAAVRRETSEEAEAEQEPVLAIILLAGIAGVIGTSFAGSVLDNPGYDGLAVAVWAFLGGGFYGLLVYWLGGLMVHAVVRGLGGTTSYRQARHVVGLAAAPLAASLLLVWPLRIAIYGGDLFRSGGSDSGLGDQVFVGLVAASYVWAFVLVVLGVLELRKRSSSLPGIS